MNSRTLLAASLILFGLSSHVLADEQSMPAAAPASKEFSQMKPLVGTWKATEIGSADAGQPFTVTYKLTGGGTALMETLAAGTTHEMLTIYSDEAGKLGMTHYCLLGNHPHMQLTKADAHELDFTMKTPGTIGPKETHMHSLVLFLQDPDHVLQKWSSYADGKESKVVTLKLERVKG